MHINFLRMSSKKNRCALKNGLLMEKVFVISSDSVKFNKYMEKSDEHWVSFVELIGKSSISFVSW